MEQPVLTAIDQREPLLLRTLEIFNWGPFSGFHTAEINPAGTAIIGMTGSGKTTLIDAFVTLLTEAPKYNLASTGGHESDRDLLSYVRGVIGSGNDSGDSAHISRKGSTSTGLCATYSDGRHTVRCAGLLWLEGISSAYSDLKRAWIFSRDPAQGLEQWLTLHHDGGLRGLKQQLRDSGDIQLFDTANGGKRAYLARVRTFFEVGDNAFNLLNRAAGLKQLNSIDEIFRELVLDDRSAFGRAAEVADDFNTLADIHAELQTARAQHRSLLPVRERHRDYQRCSDQLTLRLSLKEHLPVWFALNAARLWRVQAEELQHEVEAADRCRASLKAAAAQAREIAEAAHARYLNAGGRDIDSVRQLIQHARSETERRTETARHYHTVCQAFGFEGPINLGTFAAHQQRARHLLPDLETEKQRADDAAFQAGSVLQGHQNELARLKAEKEEVQASPGSNLPGDYQRFRAALADQLDLAPGDLPFVAELVQVKETEHDWRGAIERALGGNRLRLLVPSDHLRPALRWINHRDNRLHVRILASDTTDGSPASFFADGFTRKLEFKPHPLREPLKRFLAGHDLHCIDSTETLSQTPHALTREGSVSGKSGYFEKKDQQRLDAGWCTGFDNLDRLAEIGRLIAAAHAQFSHAETEVRQARQLVTDLNGRLTLLRAFTEISFDSIDLETARADLAAQEKRLADLTAPRSEAALALRDYEAAKQASADAAEAEKQAVAAHATAKQKHEEALQHVTDAEQRVGSGLPSEVAFLVEEHLPIEATVTARGIEAAERRAARDNDDRIKHLNQQQDSLHAALVRAMGEARHLDTGYLAEHGTELADVPAYLERLRVLAEEALPEKLHRFTNYLNQSSDQGVSQLLASIREEATRIDERIADLNRSLTDVDFKEGHFLRLDLQPIRHESLQAIERAQKELRAAALRTDDQGESHYRALKQVVEILREAAEKKHTVGAKALLDPRFRVEFHGMVIERASQRVVDKFKGSQGGSGGEKEIIASYILTASLCYALSPDGATRPIHPTIILDEAFSKSSRAVARRIVNALREFGLHPIFVTPNKEMRLLRAHTRSVVYVHRKDNRSTLASISWAELEARAQAAISSVATDRPAVDGSATLDRVP